VRPVRWQHLSLLLALLGCRDEPAARRPVRVAAASDLSQAFEAIAPGFEKETGLDVVFSFGASGHLAKQLALGAPFDVFAAADEGFVLDAVRSGACDGASMARYARGTLALVFQDGERIPPSGLVDLESARFRKIAIANPAHAPYGRAAKQALIAAGVWDSVERRLLYAENVRQALQLLETKNAEAALVAHALVFGKPSARFVDVDAALHAPLDQALAVCRRGSEREGGAAFARWVLAPRGAKLLASHGFLPPSPAVVAP